MVLDNVRRSVSVIFSIDAACELPVVNATVFHAGTPISSDICDKNIRIMGSVPGKLVVALQVEGEPGDFIDCFVLFPKSKSSTHYHGDVNEAYGVELMENHHTPH